MRTNFILTIICSIFLVSCASQMLDVVPGQSRNTKTTNPTNLKEECDRIGEIYPLLMLAAMMEGPMMCGDPHMGDDPYPCDENDTPEEKAKRAHRLEVRKKQEAAAKNVDMACDLYKEDMTNVDLKKAAEDAVAASRATDNGRL